MLTIADEPNWNWIQDFRKYPPSPLKVRKVFKPLDLGLDLMAKVFV